ncbi:MAG: hypothetical protein JWN41_757 [Thermoleophilia bacterium]|nr:hypothetical protein [Thermoleophilia bacterium]
MTVPSRAPANQFMPPMPGRTRWFYRIAGGLVLLLGGVVIAVLITTATRPSTARTTNTVAATVTPARMTETATPAIDGSANVDSRLTDDDAQALVEDSASLALDARWDEARDRLTSITDPAQRSQLGVDRLTTQLDVTRARWTMLTTQLASQVASRSWPEAQVTLAALARIAHLDDALLATQTTVRMQLAPKRSTTDVAPSAVTTPAHSSKPATGSSNRQPKPAAANTPAKQPGSTAGKPTTGTGISPASSGHTGGVGAAAATPTSAASQAQINELLQNGMDSLATEPANSDPGSLT